MMAGLSRAFLPKDFIETSEGLCFAVVLAGTEVCDGVERVLCFLRYVKNGTEKKEGWLKVSTEQANEYLGMHYPRYLHYSPKLDTQLHAVAVGLIVQHHKPKERLRQVLSMETRDKVEWDLFELCALFKQQGLDITQVGVTGSILIGAQQQNSDIDLVFYDRDIFHQARAITADLMKIQKLGDLAEKDWQEAYARRSCTLSLGEYVWHERRKFNKGLINGRKFDLNFVAEPIGSGEMIYHKRGSIKLQCRIIEDRYSFDYPALYSIDHDVIHSVVCFIATYTGQAHVGEMVEISGLLEETEQGNKRIVVGSSREAPGEYIKVIT